MRDQRQASPPRALRWTTRPGAPVAALAVKLLALLITAGGCTVSAPPIRHLQLSTAGASAGTGDVPVILIDAVELPDYLLRDELLRRIDDVTLLYDPYLRWAEPLDLAVQRVLAERLGALLDTRQVARFPDAPHRTADWLLNVRLTRFEQEATQAVLQAEGTWARGGDPGTTVHSVTLREVHPLAANASGADAARALSNLLERFARALADAQQDSE